MVTDNYQPETNITDFLWPLSARFLPDQTNLLPGEVVLLLPGASSEQLETLYQAGYKLLLAGPDHLQLLLLEAALSVIDRLTLLDAWHAFSHIRKGGHPLAQHLESLYQTTCPRCRSALSADYFVWLDDLADPQQKYLNCSQCGLVGLEPVSRVDLERLDRIETRGIHYHFLLGRTIASAVPETDPAFSRLETLHDLYTARALYVIAEIVMKLEASDLDKSVQQIFKVALAHCLLAGSSLDQAKPLKRLPRPKRFIEHNLWSLFKQRLAAWPERTHPSRISRQMADFLSQRQNSLLFFPDSAAKLRPYLAADTVSLALTTPPALNPATWALSTLWSGWLLGLKAAESRRAWLTQKWPDWDWYQRTVMHTLRPLRAVLKPEARWLITFQAEHRLQPPALVLAALRAGFEIDEWQISPDGQQLTLLLPGPDWPPSRPLESLRSLIQQEAGDAMHGYLAEAGDDADKTMLIWAAWQSLLYSGLLLQAMTSLAERRLLSWLDKQVQSVLTDF